MGYETTLFYVWLEDGYHNGKKIPNSKGTIETNLGHRINVGNPDIAVKTLVEKLRKIYGDRVFVRYGYMVDPENASLKWRIAAIGIITNSFIPITSFYNVMEKIMKSYNAESLTGKNNENPGLPRKNSTRQNYSIINKVTMDKKPEIIRPKTIIKTQPRSIKPITLTRKQIRYLVS